MKIKKVDTEAVTLKYFAKLHDITLSKTADTTTLGYAIPTGVISLPAYYFVPEDMYHRYTSGCDSAD